MQLALNRILWVVPLLALTIALPARGQITADDCKVYLEILDKVDEEVLTNARLREKVEARMAQIALSREFVSEFQGGAIHPDEHFKAIRKSDPMAMARLLGDALRNIKPEWRDLQEQGSYLRNIFWGRQSPDELAKIMDGIFRSYIPDVANHYDLTNLAKAKSLGLEGTAELARFLDTTTPDHFAAWIRLALNGPTGSVGGVHDLESVAEALGISAFQPIPGRSNRKGKKEELLDTVTHPWLSRIAKHPPEGGELGKTLEWLRDNQIISLAIRDYLELVGFSSPEMQTVALQDALRSEKGVERLVQKVFAHLLAVSNPEAGSW